MYVNYIYYCMCSCVSHHPCMHAHSLQGAVSEVFLRCALSCNTRYPRVHQARLFLHCRRKPGAVSKQRLSCTYIVYYYVHNYVHKLCKYTCNYVYVHTCTYIIYVHTHRRPTQSSMAGGTTRMSGLCSPGDTFTSQMLWRSSLLIDVSVWC